MDYKIQLSILFSLFKQGNTYNIKNTISQQQQMSLEFFWHEKLQKRMALKLFILTLHGLEFLFLQET